MHRPDRVTASTFCLGGIRVTRVRRRDVLFGTVRIRMRGRGNFDTTRIPSHIVA